MKMNITIRAGIACAIGTMVICSSGTVEAKSFWSAVAAKQTIKLTSINNKYAVLSKSVNKKISSSKTSKTKSTAAKSTIKKNVYSFISKKNIGYIVSAQQRTVLRRCAGFLTGGLLKRAE